MEEYVGLDNSPNFLRDCAVAMAADYGSTVSLSTEPVPPEVRDAYKYLGYSWYVVRLASGEAIGAGFTDKRAWHLAQCELANRLGHHKKPGFERREARRLERKRLAGLARHG